LPGVRAGGKDGPVPDMRQNKPKAAGQGERGMEDLALKLPRSGSSFLRSRRRASSTAPVPGTSLPFPFPHSRSPLPSFPFPPSLIPGPPKKNRRCQARHGSAVGGISRFRPDPVAACGAALRCTGRPLPGGWDFYAHMRPTARSARLSVLSEAACKPSACSVANTVRSLPLVAVWPRHAPALSGKGFLRQGSVQSAHIWLTLPGCRPLRPTIARST
jgi:hypothetical protein